MPWIEFFVGAGLILLFFKAIESTAGTSPGMTIALTLVFAPIMALVMIVTGWSYFEALGSLLGGGP